MLAMFNNWPLVFYKLWRLNIDIIYGFSNRDD